MLYGCLGSCQFRNEMSTEHVAAIDALISGGHLDVVKGNRRRFPRVRRWPKQGLSVERVALLLLLGFVWLGNERLRTVTTGPSVKDRDKKRGEGQRRYTNLSYRT
jgi:hypothetical protein